MPPVPPPDLQDASQHLLVVVGRSGVGKDAVIRAWQEASPEACRPHVARRVITRERHSSEAHEPVSRAGFDQLLSAGRLVFHWEAHGLHYGVRASELAPLFVGRTVVVNGSRQHLPMLRQQAPRARVVEIVLPEPLRQQRLSSRGREAPDAQAARMARELPACDADLVIDNSGPIEVAVRQLEAWWSAGPARAALPAGTTLRASP